MTLKDPLVFLAEEIAAMLVIGGFVVLLYKKGRVMLTKLRNLMSIPSKVDSIFKELKPNGGSSIADKIEAIKTEMNRNAHRTRVLWGIQGTGFYECDVHGECVYANPALCQLFGLTEEQMRGRGWLSAVVDEEERERVWSDWRAAIENDYPYDARYKILNRVRNEVIQVHVVCYVLRDQNQKPMWFFGTVK